MKRALVLLLVLAGCFSDPGPPVGPDPGNGDGGVPSELPDSGAACGNGFCDFPVENAANCCFDCGGGCGDGVCCKPSGEDQCTCPADCVDYKSFCGDGICCPQQGEDSSNCCWDCNSGCGDGICCRQASSRKDQEDVCNCPTDCGESVCGDGRCECDETCRDCPLDCGTCGNCCEDTGRAFPGAPGCSNVDIEQCVCAHDPQCCLMRWDFGCVDAVDRYGCGHCTRCGDGRCEAPETSSTCCQDCGNRCGDGVCNCGEEACGCPDDCGREVVCGNGSCDCPREPMRAESSVGCCQDCGSVCGDGVCNCDENACNCTTDCGVPRCGDGRCECMETCGTCASDCGACPSCANPIDITGMIDGEHVFGNTTGALDSDDPTCAQRDAGPELVYVIRPSFSAMMVASTIHPGTHFDTLLSARSACRDKTSEVACSDDYVNDRSITVRESLVRFVTRSENPIFLFVEASRGDGQSSGTFELSVTTVR